MRSRSSKDLLPLDLSTILSGSLGDLAADSRLHGENALTRRKDNSSDTSFLLTVIADTCSKPFDISVLCFSDAICCRSG